LRQREGAGHALAGLSFVIFMVAVAALGGLVYLTLILSHVPGATEERFGKLEPLPDKLGEWVKAGAPAADGLLREERYLFDEASKKLVLQVRHRNPETGKIERVEPEQTIKRRRIRVP
jgi:hypothetical protein